MSNTATGGGQDPLQHMSEGGVAQLDGLPSNVIAILTEFIAEARDAVADDLVSVVLFGSAAALARR